MGKNFGYENWREAKMAIRPFFFTFDTLETGSPHPNSFRVPILGAGTVGAARTGTIRIPSDLDFEDVKLTCVAYDASGNAQNHFSIEIFESAGDFRMQNNPIHMLTITGTGQMPFILPSTHLAPGAYQLNVRFTLNLATTTWIYFTFSGISYYHFRKGSITSRPMAPPGEPEAL
jgi:hypothetical protein